MLDLLTSYFQHVFTRTKTLEDVIKEWKDEDASKVTVVPFKRYGVKHGHLYAMLSMPAFVGYLLSGPSKEELDAYLEKQRGKLEGEGRFYFPDSGKNYIEYTKSGQPLPDLDNVVESLEENQLEVNVNEPEPPLDFVGVIPVGLKLKVA